MSRKHCRRKSMEHSLERRVMDAPLGSIYRVIVETLDAALEDRKWNRSGAAYASCREPTTQRFWNTSQEDLAVPVAQEFQEKILNSSFLPAYGLAE